MPETASDAHTRPITHLALFVIVLLAAGNAITAQVGRPPAFEVVSIKPTRSGTVENFRFLGQRVVATNHSIRKLVSFAYTRRPNLIVGPELLDDTMFDVEALIPQEQKFSIPLAREMMKGLLAERFSLRLKEESRPMDVYVLVRADSKLGPQLRAVQRDCSQLDAKGTQPCWMTFSETSLTARGMDWTAVDLANGPLQYVLGSHVVDRTNLKGQFDIDLKWQMDAAVANPSVEVTTDVLNAVRNQLGLRVERRRESIDVLVVEKVGLPTPN